VKEVEMKSQGTALVAAMIALLLSAGMIGGLYATARVSSRVSSGLERTRSLQEIADGMVAGCSRMIFFVTNDQNPATVYTPLPGMNLTFDPQNGGVLPVTGLNGELQVPFDPSRTGLTNYLWNSDRIALGGGSFVVVPDLVIQTRNYFIFLDMDLLYRQEVKGGSATEFGAGAEESQQTARLPLAFRCYAEVWERCTNDPFASPQNFCPHSASLGIIRVEREVTPQFVRLWGAR
jgi:hypothetical protein